MGVSAELSAQKRRWPRRGGLSVRRLRRHPTTSAHRGQCVSESMKSDCQLRTSSQTTLRWFPRNRKPIYNVDSRHHSLAHSATRFQQHLMLLVGPPVRAGGCDLRVPLLANAAKDLRVPGNPGDAVSDHEAFDTSPAQFAHLVDHELFIMVDHTPFGFGPGDRQPPATSALALRRTTSPFEFRNIHCSTFVRP